MQEGFLKGLRLGQKLMLGFGTILAVMVIIALFSYWGIDRLSETSAWETHTYNVTASLQTLKRLAVDAETGQRGYLLTGREEFLEPYNNSLNEMKAAVDTLRELVSDNPEQLERLREIEKKIQEKMDELRETINLKRAGRTGETLAIVTSGKGKQIMDDLRQRMDEMRDVENKLLAKRKQEAERAKQIANFISIGGTMIALIFGLLVAFFIISSSRKTLNEAISAISSSATEIASTVEQHERTAALQAASVNETTSTMEELGTSSSQSAEQAEVAAAAAQKASTLTTEGGERVNEAVDGMVGLKERVEAVAQQILRLSEQTTQIGNIANVVKDLAGQTNMLALNAAVEAARAGEQGKGFAVVAAEIRKLADQSKKSAEQANAIVADIQKATNTTVMMTEEGTKTVENVTQLANKVGDAFSALSSSASGIYENAQQVMLNAKQQAEAIKQVVEAMNTIATGAKDTAAGISQTRVGIQKLDETAKGLKTIV